METHWQEGLIAINPKGLKTLEGKVKEVVAQGSVNDPDIVTFKIEIENREYPFLISKANIPYSEGVPGESLEDERRWVEKNTTYPIRDIMNEFNLTDIREIALRKIEATVFNSSAFKQCVAVRFY